MMKRLLDYMNEWSEKFTQKQLKLFLISFCIVWFTGALYVMLYPSSTLFKIFPDPRHRYLLKSAVKSRQHTMDYRKAYQSIKQYQLMLNDSLIKARPGLVDTLDFLEQYYQSKK